jgi:hypothetical protein
MPAAAKTDRSVAANETAPVGTAVARDHVAATPAPAASVAAATAFSSVAAATAFSSVAAATAFSSVAAATSFYSVPQVRTVSAAPATSIARIDAAVTGVFDSVSTWLSGMPGNPVAELLQGALLLLRRSMFNHAPTGTATQTTSLPGGDIRGQVNATDPENDVITYTVVTNPQFGQVTVNEDGSFVYSPGEGFNGADTFTLALDNPGPRLNVLDIGGGPTLVTANVLGAAGSGPLVGATTRGFDVANKSTRVIQYMGSYLDSKYGEADPNFESEPEVGTLIQPGESVHFELLRYAATDTFGYPLFQAIDDPFGVADYDKWYLEFYTDAWGGAFTEKCDGGSNSCDKWDNGHGADLMDPESSTVHIAEDDLEGRATALDLCGHGATCSFSPPSGQRRFNRTTDIVNTFTDVKELYRYANDGTDPVIIDDDWSTTVSYSATVDVSSDASVDLFTIVTASISSSYSQTWEHSATITHHVSTQVQPGYELVATVQDPVIAVTGDWKIKMGDTTIYVPNATSYLPDLSGRQSRMKFTKNKLPAAPVGA